MQWPLSEAQRRTLFAALDRIVPGDDFPSATEAGADEFILRLFGHYPHLVPVYEAGIGVLDIEAGGDFTAIDPAAQDEVLLNLEHHPFVQALIQHAIEGTYSDPGNGGNRNGEMWRMIGFEVRS